MAEWTVGWLPPKARNPAPKSSARKTVVTALCARPTMQACTDWEKEPAGREL
jgi:hypothetical protein